MNVRIVVTSGTGYNLQSIANNDLIHMKNAFLKKNLFLFLSPVSALILLSFALASPAHAKNSLWIGSWSDDFNDARNWHKGALEANDIVSIRKVGMAKPDPVLRGEATISQLRVGQLAADSGAKPITLTLESGSSLATSSRTDIGYSLGPDTSGSIGALVVNGGTHSLKQLMIGIVAGEKNAVDAIGSLTLNGGSLECADGGNTGYVPVSSSNGKGTGVIKINAGAFTSGAVFSLGHSGKSVFSMNGGTAHFQTLNMTGNSKVSDSTIHLNGGTMNVKTLVEGSGKVVVNISQGVLQIHAGSNRTGIIKRLVKGTSNQGGSAVLNVMGGLAMGAKAEAVLSSTYTRLFKEVARGDYLLRYGYDSDSGITAMWAVANPATGCLEAPANPSRHSSTTVEKPDACESGKEANVTVEIERS